MPRTQLETHVAAQGSLQLPLRQQGAPDCRDAVLPDVSLDSVYRILDDFSGSGLVRRLEGVKVIRYDADTSAHEHFVCSRCGAMFDFSCLDAEKVAGLCGEFGQVDSVELTVHGVCGDCLNG